MKTIKKVSALVIALLLIMQWIPMINAGADGTASADPSTMSLSRLPEGPSGPRQPGDVPEEVEAASAEKAPTSENVEIAPARQDLSEEVRERDPASVPGNDPEADTPENLPVPEELLADAVPTEPGSTKPTIPVKGSLNWNVSESPVQSNADNGPLPNASTVFVWHSYYFNLQVTGDIQLKSCKLYVKPSGSSSYTVADDYTAGGYFRYRAVSYYFETAGSFSYYWYVTYYEGGSQTLTTTTITVNDLYYITMSQESGDCTYDGNPHSISISVSGPSSYTIYYSTTTQLTSSNYSSAGSTTKPSRTAAGGFNTYWYIKDNTGYYYDKYGNCWTFIYPAVTANAYEGTYDGSSHKPTISTSGGATLYYSKTTELDLDNYTSSGTTTVPTRTNSGGTRVYFIAVANTGEICGKRGYVWINIDPKVTASGYSGAYDGSSHKPTVSATGNATLYYSTSGALTYDNYAASGSTTLPSRTAAGTTTVYYIAIPNSDANENTWTKGSTTITINKATTSTSTSGYSGTYDGSSHSPTVTVSGPSSYTIYYSTSTSLTSSNYSSSGSTTKPTRTNSGDSTVYFYVKDGTGNYSDKSGSTYIRIKPKVTATAYSGTYDGSSHKPTMSATGSATLYYSTSTALTYSNYSSSGSTTLPTRTAAGTTTVYYIAVPSSNATEATCTTGSTTITINKATTSTSTSGYSGTYDGSSHSPTVTVSGPSSYTIYYSTSTSLTSSNYSSSGSTTKPTRTNSGDNTVYFYVKDGTGNYSDKSGSTYIRIKPKVTATAWSGTYDGSNHKPTMSATGSATLYYSTTTALTYSNYSSSGSTTLPSRTAEGTTTVYYIAVPNSNPSADTCTTGSTKIEILQHTHNYTYTVSSAPTVSATGTLSGVCSICEGTTTVTLPKLNTTDYSYKSIKAATCTATGTGRYTWKTTTYGSYYFDVILNATGHSYNSVVTAPTCTAQGYTTYTCIHGDSQYVSDYTDPTGHTWNGGVVTQQPTETSSGVKTYTCLVCGATRNEVIPPAEHVHHYVETVTPPKCTEQGYSTFRCSCGSTYQDKYVAATGHSYAYTIAAEPSVVASGRLKGICTKCSAETSVVMPNLNEDDYTRTVTVPATCTTGGTQRFTWNETAYGEYFLDLPIYPLGHDYVQGVCNRCGCLQSDPDAKLPFTDVKEGAYYYNAVRWAVNRGIATGTSATTFGTKSSCTRAQVMTFLWNAAGQPEPTSTANPFTDVKPTAYYYKPVLWAVERGIATGTTPSTFGPKGTCTRAQIVTFLWNYCGSPEPVTTQNPYTDVKPSSYYYKAVLWAYENEITTGTSLTTFGPKSICNRAQVVTFIWNALT